MKLICFVNGKGFASYNAGDDSMKFTLHIPEATEAKVEDWLDVPGFDFEVCTLLSVQSHKFEIPPQQPQPPKV